MKKTNHIIYNIMAVLGYFYGVALVATLILIPLGVYSIIAAHRFSSYADMNDLELTMHKNRVIGWTIFACILYFPFGLISIIPLSKISNDISVTNVESNQDKKDDEVPTEVEIDTPSTHEEKKEKLEKLERFKQNGLITEEEFNQAKEDLQQ